jgi:hypothetical protein
LGGQALRGTFRKKRALKNFLLVTSPPPPPLHPKKNFGQCTILGVKNFSGHTTVFPKYEKNFPEMPKNSPHIWYFPPKLRHFSGNNIDLSFQKGTLQPKKGQLPKLGGAPTPLILIKKSITISFKYFTK